MNKVVLRIMFLFLALMGQAGIGVAQDAILSQFFSSPVYMNPAFAGTDRGFRAVMNYRNHPLPDVTNFSTISTSLDVPVPALYGGLGLLVTSDYQGNLAWKNHIDAMYATHLRLTREWYLNFGVQAGYFRRDIRWDQLDFADPNQPPPEQNFVHAPNFGAGFVLFNDWIYGGIATHHMTEPNESLFSDDKLRRKHTAHLGLYLAPSPVRRANTLMVDFFVSPNIIFQNQGNSNRINYGFYAGVENLVAGVWYRQNLNEPSALIFLVGLSRENLHFGYSYDYSLSGFTDARHGIHEISISYVFMTQKQLQRERRMQYPRY